MNSTPANLSEYPNVPLYGLFAHTDVDDGTPLDVYREPERGGALVVVNGEAVHVPSPKLADLRDALTRHLAAEAERSRGGDAR